MFSVFKKSISLFLTITLIIFVRTNVSEIVLKLLKTLKSLPLGVKTALIHHNSKGMML